MFGSIFIPIILKKITYVEAARIEVHITWYIFLCTDSYDSDDDGEFYLQFKYYTGSDWRIEKTSNKKIGPAFPLPSYPSITYTLKKEVQVGTYLYIRLGEKDWLKNDLIIPVVIYNLGTGDSIHWNSFYISSSFDTAIFSYDNSPSDEVKVTFINMG